MDYDRSGVFQWTGLFGLGVFHLVVVIPVLGRIGL